ncbi:MAG: cysteine--tRNA ligase [Candidatus Curtissbacteria bacterium]|nr:cysteine--tRNA ligase [Candidatus Curtissbacteria bacterium]
MKLYNYLSKKVEEFKPIVDGKVGMYTCGPTVYDYVHIGNWRTFVFEDVLKKALTFDGYKVNHVMNITDIDDKIIKRARDESLELRDLTAKYERAFFEDLEKLNILRANEYPRATENITTMIRIIVVLLDKGFAYKADDGVYFSVEKFPDYGKLSGLEKRQLKKGARINDDLYDKESWSDFALWKNKKDREPSWPAPFGEGRPGWHIECSAMSMEALGEHFDIHCGGVDLLFPHHENEIAQSEAATGKKFVNFWLEGEHLLVDGQKMSKSLGNIYTLSDVIKKGLPAGRQGFEPLALRYLFLTAHYRSKLNFTWESLEAAQNALSNLRDQIATWDDPKIGCAGLENDFKNAVNNDLDMPRAIAIMWETVKSDNPTSAKHRSILVMDEVLGLGLGEIKKAVLPKGAKELIDEREELRKAGNFEESDKIREELLEMGVVIEDTFEGSKWKVIKNE